MDSVEGIKIAWQKRHVPNPVAHLYRAGAAIQSSYSPDFASHHAGDLLDFLSEGMPDHDEGPGTDQVGFLCPRKHATIE